MYDTQAQGSEVTILLTFQSRFSAVLIGFSWLWALASYGVLRFLKVM